MEDSQEIFFFLSSFPLLTLYHSLRESTESNFSGQTNPKIREMPSFPCSIEDCRHACCYFDRDKETQKALNHILKGHLFGLKRETQVQCSQRQIELALKPRGKKPSLGS